MSVSIATVTVNALALEATLAIVFCYATDTIWNGHKPLEQIQTFWKGKEFGNKVGVTCLFCMSVLVFH